MSGFEVDAATFLSSLNDVLVSLCSDIRSNADAAAELAAVEATKLCDGAFTVTAQPGERRHPIGGFHDAVVVISRRHAAPKSPYYQDPGKAAILFFEFGTSRQPARPFIRPAMQAGIAAL